MMRGGICMDCHKTIELLSEYVDGMLDEEMKQEVERHIATCDSCMNEYKMLRNIIDNFHELHESDLPDDFHQKLHDRLIEESSNVKTQKRNIRNKRYFATAAAALMLAISIGMAVNSGILNLNMGSSKKAESIQTEGDEKAEVQPKFNIMGAGEEKKTSQVGEVPKTSEAPQTSKPNSKQNNFAASEAPDESAAQQASDQDAVPDEAPAQDIVPKEDTTMRTMDAPKEEAQYRVVSIYMDGDGQKKYEEDIESEIEKLGGYLKNKESSFYALPEGNVDALVKKLKDEYKIENISIDTIDVTEERESLESEISELEKSKDQAQFSISSTDDEIAKKKSRLEELNVIPGYVYVQINK